MTPAILRALEQMQNENQPMEFDDHPHLGEPAIGKPISHGQILAISRKLKQLEEGTCYLDSEDVLSWHLDELLRGSQVYIEPPKPRSEPVNSLPRLRHDAC